MQEHTNLRQPDASGAEPPKENMKARTFTAIGYLALLAALVVLKAFVPNDYGSIGFDALFCAISVIGAFEFMRALGGISAAQWWCAMVTCALTTPSFAIVKMIGVAGGDPNAWMYALLVLMGVGSVGAMVTAAMLVFDFEKSDLRSTTSALFCILYCGVLCSVSSNINHMGHNSLVGITLMFCTTVAVDTFALVFGKLFGRLSYGCCEPTSAVWDCIKRFDNLKKISISPWCDEEFMADQLRGKNIIYHRKPSPNFLGVGETLDEDGFREHIEKTLKTAQGCHLEITQRDVYTVNYDLKKVQRYVEIIRESIEKCW